jgi:hypothetical protein
MVAAWFVLAFAEELPRGSTWDPRLLWATVGLLGLVLVGVLIIVWLDRWRKDSGQASVSANDQLSQFRDLRERGELSSEEFERIRKSLEPRLREELNLPTVQKSNLSPQPEPPATPAEQGGGPIE